MPFLSRSGISPAHTVQASTTKQPSLNTNGMQAGINQLLPLCRMGLLLITCTLKQEHTEQRRSWGILQRCCGLCLALFQSHEVRMGLLKVSCPSACSEQGQLSYKYLQGWRAHNLREALSRCLSTFTVKMIFYIVSNNFPWPLPLTPVRKVACFAFTPSH